MENNEASLTLVMAGYNDDYVDRLTQTLKRELSETDEVLSVRPVYTEAPEGTKSSLLTHVGALIIELAKSASLIPIISAISTWISRQPTPEMKIMIATEEGTFYIIGKLSSEERKKLFDIIEMKLG